MLALAFLVLIGVALVADGFEFHIPRGYIYFAMAFAGAVEAFNVRAAPRTPAAAKVGLKPSGPAPAQRLTGQPCAGRASTG